MNEEEEESEEEDDDGFSGQKKKEEVEEDPVERKTQQFNSDFLLVVESLMAMDPVKSEVWLWFKGRREKEVLREKIPSIFTSVSSSNHWHYNNTLMIKHHHCPTFRISKA